MTDDEKKYWMHVQRKSYGPYKVDQLMQHANSGSLISHGNTWIKASDHPDFEGQSWCPPPPPSENANGSLSEAKKNESNSAKTKRPRRKRVFNWRVTTQIWAAYMVLSLVPIAFLHSFISWWFIGIPIDMIALVVSLFGITYSRFRVEFAKIPREDGRHNETFLYVWYSIYWRSCIYGIVAGLLIIFPLIITLGLFFGWVAYNDSSIFSNEDPIKISNELALGIDIFLAYLIGNWLAIRKVLNDVKYRHFTIGLILK